MYLGERPRCTYVKGEPWEMPDVGARDVPGGRLGRRMYQGRRRGCTKGPGVYKGDPRCTKGRPRLGCTPRASALGRSPGRRMYLGGEADVLPGHAPGVYIHKGRGLGGRRRRPGSIYVYIRKGSAPGAANVPGRAPEVYICKGSARLGRAPDVLGQAPGVYICKGSARLARAPDVLGQAPEHPHPRTPPRKYKGRPGRIPPHSTPPTYRGHPRRIPDVPGRICTYLKQQVQGSPGRIPDVPGHIGTYIPAPTPSGTGELGADTRCTKAHTYIPAPAPSGIGEPGADTRCTRARTYIDNCSCSLKYMGARGGYQMYQGGGILEGGMYQGVVPHI
ncbi:hypothetical protein AMTR_s00009p00264360 [Amborella trichopoda]|uniref:Uncharacterized protein n=1 Tax=Amborella trichopoda TaxID=13333 RepID=W1NJ54_AMBTC|nr:hypothetical protein AMTR_s00009p00264360 [Amborella trichopoda]